MKIELTKNETDTLCAENNNKNEIESFDDILEIVGSDGSFQHRFNWLFNFAYAMILSMTFMNVIIALAIPEHWCYIPGRENTNYTVAEWREKTIPKEMDNLGQISFSKCKAYSLTDDNVTQSCNNGWEFDKTWYESTIVTDNDWVCDKEVYVTHSLVYSRVGEFIGTIVLGSLGDSIGRRPVFIVTVVTMTITRIVMLFTTYSYVVFMIVSILSSATLNSGFQSPLTISMEIISVKMRATLISIQYLGWTIGICILPLIMWVVRRWDYFFLITTLPGLLIFIFYKYLIESPRWLVSRGEMEKAYVQLKVIAKYNKRPLPDDFMDKLNCLKNKGESNYGLSSLISSWRLFKNTLVLCICWSATLMCYQIFIYNVTSLAGNPFLNFLFQALIELPSNLVGKLTCNYCGRRFVSLIAFMLSVAFCVILLISYNWKISMLTIGLILVVKFCLSCGVYVLNLQSLEVFPTCARQSGTSASFFCAVAVSSFSPYITYLGTQYDARIPYVGVLILALIAALSGSFLPETVDVQLPETLEDARVFGKDQLYWDFLNRKNSKYQKAKTTDECTAVKDVKV
ncbi:solute carrier family 22 member 5-like [Chrysoperla carnea]|uniref:solute carrier family 22 member 5-like n=1 Tax=Chrysoperla carnea TaxID=189513 RepID=UPI001D066813|nr:solute carrier family 22 member 5-like [Chrysoperla carnea]